MGAIELSTKSNSSLVEKAGREGFREDLPYRQFREILMNFFKQSATDFFVEEGKYADDWSETKGELKRLDEVRKNRSKQTRVRKQNFSTNLKEFFDLADTRFFESEAKNIASAFEGDIDNVLKSNKKPSDKALAIGRIERDVIDKINELRKKTELIKPRGVGLSKNTQDQWKAFQSESEKIWKTVVQPLEGQVARVVSKTVKEHKLELSAAKRLDAAILKYTSQRAKIINSDRKQASETITDLTKVVRDITKDSFQKVTTIVDSVNAELERIKSSSNIELDYSTIKQDLEKQVDEVFTEEHEKLLKLSAQLSSLLLDSLHNRAR